MSKGKLLIVDDDEDIRHLVGGSLANNGFDVITAEDGEEGVAKALCEHPDLIILDVEMPGMDGIAVCREIRRCLTTPIIFLSVRSDTPDKILGLGAGGDNYLTKPFDTSELLAYVEATIRRQNLYYRSDNGSQVIRIKDLTLDISAHELRRNGTTIPLTSTEFKLFRTLAENAGRVVTRDQLLDRVWEMDIEGIYSRTIDVHVGRIRRKIGDDPIRPSYILTVSGVGYKMPGTL